MESGLAYAQPRGFVFPTDDLPFVPAPSFMLETKDLHSLALSLWLDNVFSPHKILLRRDDGLVIVAIPAVFQCGLWWFDVLLDSY